MRRNFAQVLREGKIDIKNEYIKLYDLFYYTDGCRDISIEELIEENFGQINFWGTCLSLDEFNECYGFEFERIPQNFGVDYLVSFCEYYYNFVNAISSRDFYTPDKGFYISHVTKVIDAIGYMFAQEDGFTIFVPKDNAAIAVSESELIPKAVSYKIIAYNHHAKKGDLEAKRQILLALSDLLEPKRKDLELVDKQFASDLFYALNNFNVRHNNVDPTGPKYKKPVGDLSEAKLEQWYDEVYQMCLLAFMRLDHVPRKQSFDELKGKIENK